MKQTTTPINYNFALSYYQNFLQNRVGGLVASGKVNTTLKKDFIPNIVPININGNDCIGHIDIKAYIKRTYNGDKPVCLDQQIVQKLDEFSRWTDERSSIDEDTLNFFNDVFGTDYSGSEDVYDDIERSDLNPSNWKIG